MTQPPLCYPHPAGHHLGRPPNSDLHDTAGLPGFWALDFMAPGGTPVLASEDGVVVELSGHDPATGVHEGDIFGWNVYWETPGGVEFFDTHLGDRTVKVGARVRRGDLLGHVGHWPGQPSRSHTHRGCHHPYGKKPSVARIEAIAQAVMLPFPPVPPAVTWPAVFDGIGALVVNCALDPYQLVDRIPGLTWIAFKVGGTDVAGDTETQHCVNVWRGMGLKVGAWTYCYGPPVHDTAVMATALRFGRLDFYVYDVEREYKTDEGAPADWPAQLVTHGGHPAAVTSYGAIPGYGTQASSIDFHPFAAAGWPILAQCYGDFSPGDELTYKTVYPREGIHQMVRELELSPSMAVYRPEGIDG